MAAFVMLKLNGGTRNMETAEQSTKQFVEENDVIKQSWSCLTSRT